MALGTRFPFVQTATSNHRDWKKHYKTNVTLNIPQMSSIRVDVVLTLCSHKLSIDSGPAIAVCTQCFFIGQKRRNLSGGKITIFNRISKVIMPLPIKKHFLKATLSFSKKKKKKKNLSKQY